MKIYWLLAVLLGLLLTVHNFQPSLAQEDDDLDALDDADDEPMDGGDEAPISPQVGLARPESPQRKPSGSHSVPAESEPQDDGDDMPDDGDDSPVDENGQPSGQPNKPQILPAPIASGPQPELSHPNLPRPKPAIPGEDENLDDGDVFPDDEDDTPFDEPNVPAPIAPAPAPVSAPVPSILIKPQPMPVIPAIDKPIDLPEPKPSVVQPVPLPDLDDIEPAPAPRPVVIAPAPRPVPQAQVAARQVPPSLPSPKPSSVQSVLISRGKAVSQSSVAFDGPAQYAIDGGYNQNYFSKSCTHTNIERNPWWRIDLGSRHFIDHVKVWNRADCCGERLGSLKVQVSDDGSSWKDAGSLQESARNAGVYNIKVSSAGRFVRLVLGKDQAEYLTLCEVEVHGSPSDQVRPSLPSPKPSSVQSVLISRGKPVSQSSVAFDGPAKYAIDGGYNQNYFSKSCTHTNIERHPWWRVDLGPGHFIDHVKVWNRADCCGERLNSLKVQVSDDGSNWKDAGFLQESARNGGVYNIKVSSSGRYVQLILGKDQAEYLTLCEVEVHGSRSGQVPPPPRPVLIQHRPQPIPSQPIRRPPPPPRHTPWWQPVVNFFKG